MLLEWLMRFPTPPPPESKILRTSIPQRLYGLPDLIIQFVDVSYLVRASVIARCTNSRSAVTNRQLLGVNDFQ